MEILQQVRNASWLINFGLTVLLGLIMYQGVQLQRAIETLDTRIGWRGDVIERLDRLEYLIERCP